MKTSRGSSKCLLTPSFKTHNANQNRRGVIICLYCCYQYYYLLPRRTQSSLCYCGFRKKNTFAILLFFQNYTQFVRKMINPCRQIYPYQDIVLSASSVCVWLTGNNCRFARSPDWPPRWRLDLTSRDHGGVGVGGGHVKLLIPEQFLQVDRPLITLMTRYSRCRSLKRQYCSDLMLYLLC